MDLIYRFFSEHLDIVFFVYGFAFLVMGVAILVQPKKGSEIRMGGILWILAVFAITHGINEFLDMWAIIKGRSMMLDIVRCFALLISYCFLFEFGRELFRLTGLQSSGWHKKISSLLTWWLLSIPVFFIFAFSLLPHDFWKTVTIWTRYLLGFPGSLLTGFGFFLYYKNEKAFFGMQRVKIYFLLISGAFLIYAVLGGVIVPQAGFFPASWLNTESFFSFVKVPVQFFRTCCAVAASLAMTGMLTMFSFERDNKLKEAQDLLKEQLLESEERYMEIVESSPDMIYSVDKNDVIICANKQGYDALSFSAQELVGNHIKEIFPPETLAKVEEALKKLEKKGIIIIDDGEIIKKDGKRLKVEINLMSTYDAGGKFLWTRIIVRDITEQDKLNRELKERIRELEEFYDIAVERELRMIELKVQTEKLKKETEKFRV